VLKEEKFTATIQLLNTHFLEGPGKNAHALFSARADVGGLILFVQNCNAVARDTNLKLEISDTTKASIVAMIQVSSWCQIFPLINTTFSGRI